MIEPPITKPDYARMEIKSIGFTGAQGGMNANQLSHFIKLLTLIRNRNVLQLFHHGDCIGADYQAVTLAQTFGYYTISHPPITETKRVFHGSDSIYVAKPYAERNQDIVNSCELLIATPRTNYEITRSGTWSTIRKARKRNILIRNYLT